MVRTPSGRRSEARGDERGFVYILGAEHSGMAKIGFATNPKKRVAGLRTSNHLRLHLMYLKAGTFADEYALMIRFRPLRVRASWFHFDPGNELAEFVLEAQKDPFHILDIEDCDGIE